MPFGRRQGPSGATRFVKTLPQFPLLPWRAWSQITEASMRHAPDRHLPNRTPPTAWDWGRSLFLFPAIPRPAPRTADQRRRAYVCVSGPPHVPPLRRPPAAPGGTRPSLTGVPHNAAAQLPGGRFFSPLPLRPREAPAQQPTGLEVRPQSVASHRDPHREPRGNPTGPDRCFLMHCVARCPKVEPVTPHVHFRWSPENQGFSTGMACKATPRKRVGSCRRAAHQAPATCEPSGPAIPSASKHSTPRAIRWRGWG